MKGKLFKGEYEQWLVSYEDNSEPTKETKIKDLQLHPDDVNDILEQENVFDNIEARILSYPDVEFEIVQIKKMSGVATYAKLKKGFEINNVVDITKCIGCRKGIKLFREKNGDYYHVDLFATAESGSEYKCENSDTIGKFLIKNEETGTILPNDELSTFFINQSLWWENIIDLAEETFEDNDMVLEFFNSGEKDNKVWNKSNLDIENSLLEIVEKKGLEISEYNYPFLIKWNISDTL